MAHLYSKPIALKPHMSEEGASHLIPRGVFRLRFTCYAGFLSDIGCFFFPVQRMCFEMRTRIVKTQASPQAFLDLFTQPLSSPPQKKPQNKCRRSEK